MPRGRWCVVDAASAPACGFAVSDRFLRGGEEVQFEGHEPPELVQQVALGGGVVPPVERVLTDNVVVLGLDGCLIVFLVGSGSGERNIFLLEPASDVMVDEFAPVIGIEPGDRERE